METAQSLSIKSFSPFYICRLVYSQKKPTQEQMDQLAVVIEDAHFVCGSSLIPDGRFLSEIFGVQTNVSCEIVVSYHYFSCGLKLKTVCYKCGSENDLIEIEPEEKKNYQSIHTLCNGCKQGGATFRVRCKVKVAEKKGRKRPHSKD